jgi:hypothetical protein
MQQLEKQMLKLKMQMLEEKLAHSHNTERERYFGDKLERHLSGKMKNLLLESKEKEEQWKEEARTQWVELKTLLLDKAKCFHCGATDHRVKKCPKIASK